MRRPACKIIDLTYCNDTEFRRRSVGCLIHSHDKKILLQLRDHDAPTFPDRLTTFGGGIKIGESPIEALLRELKEELGAKVLIKDVIPIGLVTEPETDHRNLLYLYYWHDVNGSITGCYEGYPAYFNDPHYPMRHPSVMSDVIWVIGQCQRRGLLY